MTNDQTVETQEVEADPVDALLDKYLDSQAEPVEEVEETEEVDEEEAEETPEPEPEESVKVSRGLAKLTQKEKDLRAREEQIKSQHQRVEQFNQLLQSARQNPLAVLDAAGVTLDQLADYIQNGKIEDKPDDRVARLEQMVEQEKAARLQYEQQVLKTQQDQIVMQFKENIDQVVEEKFPLVSANKSSSVVFDLIAQHLQATGQLLDIEQAAQLIEEELQEIANRARPSVEMPQKRQTKKSATLSNKLNSQPAKVSGRSRSQAEEEAAVDRLINDYIRKQRN